MGLIGEFVYIPSSVAANEEGVYGDGLLHYNS